RLTWIDNLETGSGLQLDDPDHADFAKPYVQSYIAQFGVRKCEANALVVAPEIGRRLCRDANRHIPADAPEKYQRKLDRVRLQLRRGTPTRPGSRTANTTPQPTTTAGGRASCRVAPPAPAPDVPHATWAAARRCRRPAQ